MKENPSPKQEKEQEKILVESHNDFEKPKKKGHCWLTEKI